MEKILIIKLGAKGDVLRTIPLLSAIKQKYPDSEITWITKPNSRPILENISLINRLFTIPIKIDEKFDVLYNFDIEEDATQLANSIDADKKLGFSSDQGYATAFNFPAEYYLNTLFDDELKKSNKKTYQQMMFDAAELDYNKHHYQIQLSEQDKRFAEDFAAINNINKEKLIGIHIGASPRWPSKAWHLDKIKELIKMLDKKGFHVLLFAGPDDIENHSKIANDLALQSIKVYKNNPHNADKEFFSLIDLCKKIVCVDSYALHVALALKKPTTALFFCTSPDEVEDYGLLKKIVSPRLYEFFPERSDQYDEGLVNSISAQQVLDSLENNNI